MMRAPLIAVVLSGVGAAVCAQPADERVTGVETCFRLARAAAEICYDPRIDAVVSSDCRNARRALRECLEHTPPGMPARSAPAETPAGTASPDEPTGTAPSKKPSATVSPDKSLEQLRRKSRAQPSRQTNRLQQSRQTCLRDPLVPRRNHRIQTGS
jgi:hypothetical protein